MKYAKPEIVPLASAMGAIHNHCDKGASSADNCQTGDDHATPTAYEADE
jgi:hypothetical protein